MILTNCAACAAPLAHTAPRCVRCHTRYCNQTCQHDHWRRGHKQMCKKIHRGGNAEQYHADKKYKEAVAVAVEACAADTKGQKCYLCLEAVHPHTGEGLVRGCACGDRDGVKSPELGVAHVSCLARQAKILWEEAEENRLRGNAKSTKWARWYTCSLCEQNYHGVVACTMGWACWKTYLGRSEEEYPRRAALNLLAGGLYSVKNFKEAASVHETQLSLSRRLGASEHNILMMQSNLSNLYEVLGRREEALEMLREVYDAWLKLQGPRDRATLKSACDLAGHMISNSLLDEAKQFLSEQIPLALEVLGPDDMETLKMRWRYALALGDPKDYDETVAILEDVARRSRRVFGDLNPMTTSAERGLRQVRERLGKPLGKYS